MPAVHCLVTSKFKAVIFTFTSFCPSSCIPSQWWCCRTLSHPKGRSKRLWLFFPLTHILWFVTKTTRPTAKAGSTDKLPTALYTYAVPATNLSPVLPPKSTSHFPKRSVVENPPADAGDMGQSLVPRIPPATGQLSLRHHSWEQLPLARLHKRPMQRAANIWTNKYIIL